VSGHFVGECSNTDIIMPENATSLPNVVIPLHGRGGRGEMLISCSCCVILHFRYSHGCVESYLCKGVVSIGCCVQRSICAEELFVWDVIFPNDV